tara:strand:- start:240 stop:941 length:702 start_codon:yes stop_codon:yes gene_type:complete
MNECFKRIILDIQDLKKDPIESIYYFPCEQNITRGHALVYGPKNTPYEHGNYLFHFKFPSNYPYEPPKVTYLTNDGHTRFNPNFYRNGKVCLSLLNTWEGEKWSACQSIRSILLTLQMTMNENPLLNEPGVHEQHHFANIRKYNQIIEYKNIELTILKYNLNPSMIPIQTEEKNEIKETIHQHFKNTFERIVEKIKENKEKVMNKSVVKMGIYSQEALLNYDILLQQCEQWNK